MKLADYEFSPAALREITRIFRHSEATFGLLARQRYQALIEQAIADLIEDPERPGTQTSRARIHYHLRHSRNRFSDGRVREPRHILVCKVLDETLYILAVGHDAMEESLARRIEEGEGG